jgi:hypothetical protein
MGKKAQKRPLCNFRFPNWVDFYGEGVDIFLIKVLKVS